jgi:hypothetical protein
MNPASQFTGPYEQLIGLIRRSKLGVSIINSTRPQDPIQVDMTGRTEENFVEADLIANHVVMISAMTGLTVPWIINFNSICASILLNCSRRSFRLRIQRNVMERLFGDVDEHVMLQTLISREAEIFRIAGLGRMTLQDAMVRIPEAQDIINKSPLRITSVQERPDFGRHAYCDWFLTITGDAFHVDNPEDLERIMIDFLHSIQERTRYMKDCLIAECRQVIVHYHGILRMVIPVTITFMKEIFPSSTVMMLEPIYRNLVACYVYIESQRTSKYWAIPHINQVMAQIRESQQVTPEALYLKGRASTRIEWKKAAKESIERGTPWYALRSRTIFLSRNDRQELDRLSKRMAIRQIRTWNCDIISISVGEIEEVYGRYIRHFGEASLFDARRGMNEWGGEPVIICYTERNIFNTRWMIKDQTCRVVAVIKISEVVDSHQH